MNDIKRPICIRCHEKPIWLNRGKPQSKKAKYYGLCSSCKNKQWFVSLSPEKQKEFIEKKREYDRKPIDDTSNPPWYQAILPTFRLEVINRAFKEPEKELSFILLDMAKESKINVELLISWWKTIDTNKNSLAKRSYHGNHKTKTTD